MNRTRLDKLVTGAIYAALAVTLAAEFQFSYNLGRGDAEIEYTERLIAETQAYIDQRVATRPAILVVEPQRRAVEPEPEQTVTPVDSYRPDVPLSRELQEVLREACRETNIDVALALGLIEVESNFDPDAVSSCGCYGLCQLHPAYFPPDLDAADNIRMGVSYLAECVERYGDLEAGLRAYNRGYDDGDRTYSRAVLEAAERWR